MRAPFLPALMARLPTLSLWAFSFLITSFRASNTETKDAIWTDVANAGVQLVQGNTAIAFKAIWTLGDIMA